MDNPLPKPDCKMHEVGTGKIRELTPDERGEIIVTIRGHRASGKTAVASFLSMFMETFGLVVDNRDECSETEVGFVNPLKVLRAIGDDKRKITIETVTLCREPTSSHGDRATKAFAKRYAKPEPVDKTGFPCGNYSYGYMDGEVARQVRLQWNRYPDNARISLELYDCEDGKLVRQVSVNQPTERLFENEFFCDDAGKNAGIVAWLIDNEIAAYTGRTSVTVERVTKIMRVLIPA